jgi:hypothetical protein
MKRNKKYWKEQSNGWKKIARGESEQANDWAAKAKELEKINAELAAKVINAEAERDHYKREILVLRQYNIGNKNQGVTSTSTDNWAKWAIKQYNIPVGMDDKAKQILNNTSSSTEKTVNKWWRRKR